MSLRAFSLRAAVIAATWIAAVSQVAPAQGALSNQGFGYPTGQLSSGALGSGGAGAESDPASPLNPAAITQNSRYAVFLQFEPEFRTTEVDGRSASARLLRFPTFQVTGSWRRFTGSVGVSNLLDRSWTNVYSDSLLVGGDWVPSTLRASSTGAMSDVRVALGYVISSRLQVGAALHGIAGENSTEFIRSFDDSSGVGDIGQRGAVSFSGSAFSVGAVAIPIDKLVLAASFRQGGDLRLEENRVEVATAGVPQRFGVGVSWLAIPGASVSARLDQTRWTDMRGLGTAAVTVFDATELSLGADILGPRIAGANSVVRAGIRDRSLPFGVLGDRVRERAVSLGAGLPVARGRGQVDVAVQRAQRSALGASERGWFLSLGLGIRP